jgi:hypothetical protein
MALFILIISAVGSLLDVNLELGNLTTRYIQANEPFLH